MLMVQTVIGIGAGGVLVDDEAAYPPQTGPDYRDEKCKERSEHGRIARRQCHSAAKDSSARPVNPSTSVDISFCEGRHGENVGLEKSGVST